jgi:hypothetical protein
MTGKPDARAAPLVYARVAGLLYLVLLICGPFSMIYVPFRIIVPGDAAATAVNIAASEFLFRLSLISDSIIFLSEVTLSVVLYVLFVPVSKTVALVAAFSRLVMAAVQGANLLFNVTALLLVGGATYLAAFETAQLHALVRVALDAHAYGNYVWGAFFGLHCFALGVLLLKAGYFPKALGVLMVLTSFGYLLNSFGNLLVSGYEGVFGGIVGVTSLLGEFPFVFWLLFKGVDADKWNKRRGEQLAREATIA